MARSWTCHWQFKYWRDDVNREFEPVDYSGSNRFVERGVARGDRVFVISLSAGQLYLGGRMIVDRIVNRAAAVRATKNPDLYEDADEWALAKKADCTPLDLQRRLAPEVTHSLWFLSPNGQRRQLFFESSTHLNGQATRGVNQLTTESADVFDAIIAKTDSRRRNGKPFVVTEETAAALQPVSPGHSSVAGVGFVEGAAQDVVQTRYERDPKARAACLAHYGATCAVCKVDFARRYGRLAEGFIHVHHLVPLSAVGKGYRCDPIRDLRPLCPNCHAVAHRRTPPLSIDELFALWLEGADA